MIYTLENENIRVVASSNGGELHSIKKINDETANKVISKYPIDWYIFDETAIQEEEIKDLKEHYKLVLEVK